MSERPFPETAELEFEWDPRKNRANVLKHDISFENARRAFSGPMLHRIDKRRNYGEVRWLGLGRINDVVVMIAFTMRSGKVRIISARRANRNEAKEYEQIFGHQKGPGR